MNCALKVRPGVSWIPARRKQKLVGGVSRRAAGCPDPALAADKLLGGRTAVRFLGFLGALIVGTVAAPAAISSVQGPPEPTAFDGKYVGTAALTRAAGACRTITSVDMTITGGQVVIHLKYFNTEGRSTYVGTVNGAGEVSASREVQAHVGYGHWITISGIIRDKVFTGSRTSGASSTRSCFYSFEMLKE
jgi:hypothetical protein